MRCTTASPSFAGAQRESAPVRPGFYGPSRWRPKWWCSSSSAGRCFGPFGPGGCGGAGRGGGYGTLVGRGTDSLAPRHGGDTAAPRADLRLAAPRQHAGSRRDRSAAARGNRVYALWNGRGRRRGGAADARLGLALCEIRGARVLGDGRLVRRCAAPGSKVVRGVAVKRESVIHRLADILHHSVP